MNRARLQSSAVLPETFEVVSYRDSIKIVDLSSLCPVLRMKHKNGYRLWVVKDICGVLCVAFTYSLVIFAEFVACFFLFYDFLDSTHTAVNAVIFQLCTALAIFSHMKCMFTDPGAVPRGNATREKIAKLNVQKGDVIYRCPKCICVKPDRAHHCRVCRRCIRKMDHHCPWVNNCIGENNQKYFLLFTIYTCIISCHALYITIYQLLSWSRHNWIGFTNTSSAFAIILSSLLILEGVVFAIFTGAMFSSQLWAVATDETCIERLKKDNRERLPWWLAIKEVFGHPFSYRWFSPFHSGPQCITVDGSEVDEIFETNTELQESTSQLEADTAIE